MRSPIPTQPIAPQRARATVQLAALRVGLVRSGGGAAIHLGQCAHRVREYSSTHGSCSLCSSAMHPLTSSERHCIATSNCLRCHSACATASTARSRIGVIQSSTARRATPSCAATSPMWRLFAISWIRRASRRSCSRGDAHSSHSPVSQHQGPRSLSPHSAHSILRPTRFMPRAYHVQQAQPLDTRRAIGHIGAMDASNRLRSLSWWGRLLEWNNAINRPLQDTHESGVIG
jgi:hypothetical protein